jgi:diacylglycerol kinase (ATP)
MRAFVVVNPAAGGGRGRRLWTSLKERLARAGLDFEFAETTGRGSAIELTQSAVRAGGSFVVAVGGDGTVNEVVNGLIDDSGHPLATLGVIAAGRGRDVCRNFGLATQTDVAVGRLVEGADIVVDVGRAQWTGARPRYFVNSAGVGFDGAVAERVQSGRVSGTVPYLLGIAAVLRTYRPSSASILVDGQAAFTGRIMSTVVANGSHYGGGMKIAPSADPTDGCLDVVVVGDLGRIELLRWLPAVYRGTHLANPKVTVRPARTVAIATAESLPVHLDGECVAASPVRFDVCPRALRLRR